MTFEKWRATKKYDAASRRLTYGSTYTTYILSTPHSGSGVNYKVPEPDGVAEFGTLAAAEVYLWHNVVEANHG